MKRHRSIPAFLVATTLLHAPAASADVVLDWNEIGLARALAARQLPPDAARSMAIMHVAMFDAVNAIERKYRPYAYEGARRGGASPEAAAATAAHATLSRLFPGEAQALDAAYAASLAGIGEGEAKAMGVALGREVAEQCLQKRSQDGTGVPGPYKPRVQPGVYVATVYPVSSEWARVKPFVMADTAQFRPPPPPSLENPFVVARPRGDPRRRRPGQRHTHPRTDRRRALLDRHRSRELESGRALARASPRLGPAGQCAPVRAGQYGRDRCAHRRLRCQVRV
jgi:hypothetical protein